MDKNFQNYLTLLPIGINIVIGGLSKKSRILIFTIIIGIQIFIFLATKPPSCHQIECPKIEKNNERILFYEKYNIQDDDLNLLRSEHFQQGYIINAFNFQLGVFLIFFPLFYQEQYEKIINSVLYVILAIFSIEASFLLSTEIIKIPLFNLTYFELFSFIRIQEISLILIVRELCSFFNKTNVDILRESIILQKKNLNHKESLNLNQIEACLWQLEEKPQESFFSTKYTRYFIGIFGIYQMFL
ncbi:unnamed protein product [Paramecium pentaurelia]|uniref:Transmembrane protein n=1 Tax=Paramecium pentaurelia TaxID=43138 RepID=A0A8S1TI11_9CILI|nr:unnamed protein product [Paramecium pentaurelia]